jgi:hypothetical protein
MGLLDAILIIGILCVIGYYALHAYVRVNQYVAAKDPITSSIFGMLDEVGKQCIERNKQYARKRMLNKLETDLSHAQRLMNIENEAVRLREKYNAGRKNSQSTNDVKEELDRIFNEIEYLKRER